MRCTAKRPTVLSLFTGAGGLDLGLETAGFETRLCVEIDDEARATIRRNRPEWKLATPGDIHQHAPGDLLALSGLDEGELDLLAGGPPCQPFSKSGYWLAGDSKRLGDPRAATLDAYLRVVEAALPRAMLLENVRGLTFDGKDEGFRLLEQGLERINRRKKTNYQVTVLHLNAACYGVPQLRDRVFIIASRAGTIFEMPAATHGDSEGFEPYRTAWDAIGDLDVANWPDELAPTGKWAKLLPSIPEGQNYLWHTPGGGGEPLFGWRTRFWSFLLKLAKDRPSWTIQAEPGPATGPFHWRSRLLSVRELCRLQTFPDDYVIEGDRRSAQRQLGNAVPCALAELLGLEIQRQILGSADVRMELQLLPARRASCPPPQRRGRVPKEYLALRGKHRPHPGTGLGPGALRREREHDLVG
ncbi:DNA cytosine methyltransferase [Polyangium sp. y55x31]|uniref:DNA cytosine methyltransferase n=1 Tax=Polyangium sp. y55x31 TaxID=3042688 RepID=UPI0024826DB7|nr:DNA cytosine methyltransferase [Polyangium sp. y55x31]MDI1480383.1 DNA cytosine methyltransferase [Polyangium sp. y55x31]